MSKDGERYCGVVLEYPGVEKAVATSIKSAQIKAPSIDKMGISFIGAGNFARGVLLPIVKREPKTQLIGVTAATGLSAKNTGEQFGFTFSGTDHKEVLANEESPVVFIATRHDTHASLAAESLYRGKAVFVEKPLAMNIEGLREVMKAQRESSGLLMVGYNRRFAPLARQVKERLGELIGPMTIAYRVNAGQLPAEHWSLDENEGGGRVIGEVCHFVDFIQYLTDALPVRVCAEVVACAQRAGFIDDSIAINLGLNDGSVASIIYTASGDKSVAKERVEVFCDRSYALIDDFKTGQFIREGKTTKLGRGGQDKGHAAEISAFLGAVRDGADAPISIESLAATSLATFAIIESARSGQTVAVDLNLALG
jgi:polar amino acid transport system substrate-binding protein